MAALEIEAPLLCFGDRALEDPARVGRERLAVEEAVGETDRGVPLPGHDAGGREVRHDGHVAELQLVPHSGVVRHHARVVDREHRHAEVEPLLGGLFGQLEGDHLGARRAEQVAVVHAQPCDSGFPKVVELHGCSLGGPRYVSSRGRCGPPGSTSGGRSAEITSVSR